MININQELEKEPEYVYCSSRPKVQGDIECGPALLLEADREMLPYFRPSDWSGTMIKVQNILKKDSHVDFGKEDQIFMRSKEEFLSGKRCVDTHAATADLFLGEQVNPRLYVYRARYRIKLQR